jgi:hypothetical protein
MALLLPLRLTVARPAIPDPLERAEVVDDRGATPTEHLDTFFWQCWVAVCEILEAGDRAISKCDLDDYRFDRLTMSFLTERLPGNANGEAFRKVTSEVEEVA